jgi:hypothetical protein
MLQQQNTEHHRISTSVERFKGYTEESIYGLTNSELCYQSIRLKIKMTIPLCRYPYDKFHKNLSNSV